MTSCYMEYFTEIVVYNINYANVMSSFLFISLSFNSLASRTDRSFEAFTLMDGTVSIMDLDCL